MAHSKTFTFRDKEHKVTLAKPNLNRLAYLGGAMPDGYDWLIESIDDVPFSECVDYLLINIAAGHALDFLTTGQENETMDG